MIAAELIDEIIVPLRTSDTVETAISMMEEFKVSHLPVVNNIAYVALVSESDVDAGVEKNSPVGSINLSRPRPMVNS